MKNRAPDQAERLRQLAAQEDPAPAAAVLEPPPVVDADASADAEITTPDRAIVTPEVTPAIDPAPTKSKTTKDDSVVTKTEEAEEPAPKEEVTTKPEEAKAPEIEKPQTPEENKAKPEPAKPEAKIESKPDPVALPVEEPAATPAPKVETKPAAVHSLHNMRKTLSLSAKGTRVVAISGGKGGVGKSNVACNLGIAMSNMGKNVLLFDADLSLANVDVLLGLTPRLNLSHVISGEKTLDEILITGPAGMRLLPGGSGIEELSELNDAQMESLFKGLETIEPAPDVLLIDTAAGIHPNVLQFVLAADQTIVVTTPEPTAYTDAYALIKTMVKHNATKEISVLVNMAQDSREATEVVKLLLQICRQMMNVTFNNMGYIPRDNDVLKSVRHQNPFILRAPDCAASKAIRNMASTLLQIKTDPSKDRSLSGFFRKLFQKREAPKKKAQ